MKIYYAKIVEPLTESRINTALQLLPKTRIGKIEKTKPEKSRLQSISAGLLLEYGLREHGISGTEVTFLTNRDGKPYIKEYPGLCYNLSHSGDYAALVTDEVPVGIDIEAVRKDCQKLVRRFFSEEEAKTLESAWSDDAFTRIWTRKESYLKAAGYGMRMPLDGFSTLDETVRVNEKMCEEMRHPDEIFYLKSFPLGDYWLSVCRSGRRTAGDKACRGQEEAERICAAPVEVDLGRMLC